MGLVGNRRSSGRCARPQASTGSSHAARRRYPNTGSPQSVRVKARWAGLRPLSRSSTISSAYRAKPYSACTCGRFQSGSSLVAR